MKRLTRFEGELKDITGCTNIECKECKYHSISKCDAVRVVNGFAKFELNWSWIDDKRHGKGRTYYRHPWCKENELTAEEIDLLKVQEEK